MTNKLGFDIIYCGGLTLKPSEMLQGARVGGVVTVHDRDDVQVVMGEDTWGGLPPHDAMLYRSQTVRTFPS